MYIGKVVILAVDYVCVFLSMTKAMLKEMLPIVDKSVIQYIVECCKAALENLNYRRSWQAGY